MATRFRALAAPVDASTGDRRRFAADALTAAPCPMPLRYAPEDMGGHDGAVTIGAIQSLEMDGSQVWASGTLFDDVNRETMPRMAENVAEAMKLITEGVAGLSVDLDDFDAVPVLVGTDTPVGMDDLEDPAAQMELLITKGRIRAATLVDIPAYVETNHTFELFDGAAPVDPAMVASLSGSTSLPVADRGMAWDGPAAAGRIFDAHSDKDGNVDKAGTSPAFLWVDGDGTKRGDYKLGFADMVDGKLQIVPRGVAAAAGGRGVDATDLSDSDKSAIKGRICELYGHIQNEFPDWPDCPFDSSAASSAALIAALGPASLVPLSAFTPPVVTKPTPMTYDFAHEPPIAYGHILTWNTCHEGFKESCVVAPRDPTGEYREFHTHRRQTDGGAIYAGRITAGGKHVTTEDDSLTAHSVRKAHDGMTTVAYVRAIEDEFGVLVCGPIEGELDDATMRILSRRKVSGDWRETSDGLELVEVLALRPGPRHESEPGFPITFSFRDGRQVALCASLGPEADDVPGNLLNTAEIFRQAYHVIRGEEAKLAAAEVARGELAAALASDAEMMAADLIEATGV